ncbi:MAG: RNA polymerase sigma factor [Candidatus Binatia bacterium]
MQKAEVLSSLYPRFGSRIYGFLRRLTQDDLLAEDLTQETFLRAAEALGTFRGDGKVSNWLYRIATNLFRDHVRKRANAERPLWEETEDTEADEDAVSALPDSRPLPPELVERHAVTQCVRDCIGILPAPYRAALLLYAVEGKTVEESAAILGCSKGAVKVRLHRARQLFKELAVEHCEVSADDRGGDVICLPKRSVRRPVS